MDRLRESVATLTQRLSDNVAEAERAGNDEQEVPQAKSDEEVAAAAAGVTVAALREKDKARCLKETEVARAKVRSTRRGRHVVVCACACFSHCN